MSGHAPADPFDVVVVGSLNLDLVVATDRHPSPGETVSGTSYDEFAGGKGLNQAVAAARCGARVAMVGAVGADDAGERLRHVARSEGIDDTWIETVPGTATGRALITVAADGENSIVVIAGANALVRWPATRPPVGAVVLAQLEIPRDVVTRALSNARTRGSTTMLNPSPGIMLDPHLVSLCSILVPNQHEAEQIGSADTLLEAGVDSIITTLGSRGVQVQDRGGTSEQPAFAVQPIDTTGAGDAFCGNLAARVAAGDPLDQALRWASAAGALATTRTGAVPSLPQLAAVAALLAV